MKLASFCNYLTEKGITFEQGISLAQFTTWKIGGPADVFVHLKKIQDLPLILESANQFEVPVTFLGGGSNVLINDNGIRGLTIKNEISGIFVNNNKDNLISNSTQESIQEPNWTATDNYENSQPQARLTQIDTREFYDFAALDYDEASYPKTLVTILSGTNLSFTINNLISQGITGLQWFAGIPGTIGGAIFNNIHGGKYFISDFVKEVELCTSTGKFITLSKNDLKFDYDFSGLQQGKNFIIKANFELFLGDKVKALQTAIAWAQAKRIKQPYNTAGCCFKNLAQLDQERLKLDSNSWGYINDKILKLSGKQIGGAKISDKHAAFIENTGNATAADVLALLNRVYQTAKEKFIDCTPKTEIFFLGFSKDEIKKFL